MKKYNGFYLMCSYPDRETFIKAAVKGLEHFDFLEIGAPFSDPIADGPVIAEASHHVLSAGFTFNDLISSLKEIRIQAGMEKDIYLMTYSNIIYNRGADELNSLCRDYRIKGLIIPDIPFCERGFFRDLNPPVEIPLVNFITPESSEEAIKGISGNDSPFIYFISKRGITGGGFSLDEETRGKIELAGKFSSSPVVLGFGISDSSSAIEALKNADGFIMGTALAKILKNKDIKAYGEFVGNLFSDVGLFMS